MLAEHLEHQSVAKALALVDYSGWQAALDAHIFKDVGRTLALRHLIDIFQHMFSDGLSHVLNCVYLFKQKFRQFDSFVKVSLSLFMFFLLLFQFLLIHDTLRLECLSGMSLINMTCVTFPLFNC